MFAEARRNVQHQPDINMIESDARSRSQSPIATNKNATRAQNGYQNTLETEAKLQAQIRQLEQARQEQERLEQQREYQRQQEKKRQQQIKEYERQMEKQRQQQQRVMLLNIRE